MNKKPASAANPSLPSEPLDWTKLTAADLTELRQRLIEGARRTVDRHGTGFDATMMSTDDMGLFFTDPLSFGDWWNWVIRLVDVILLASRRIGLGLIAGGTAIAASNMFNSPAGADFAKPTLGVAALFGAWFVVDSLRAGISSRK